MLIFFMIFTTIKRISGVLSSSSLTCTIPYNHHNLASAPVLLTQGFHITRTQKRIRPLLWSCLFLVFFSALLLLVRFFMVLRPPDIPYPRKLLTFFFFPYISWLRSAPYLLRSSYGFASCLRTGLKGESQQLPSLVYEGDY